VHFYALLNGGNVYTTTRGGSGLGRQNSRKCDQ